MRRTLPCLIALLCACNMLVVTYAVAGTGTITGRVLLEDGTPATAGLVAFYKKKEIPFDPQKYHFEPEEAALIETDGSFTAYLQAGTYYLGAISRASNDIVGPPRKDEYHAIFRDEKGRPNEHIIKTGETSDIGNLIGLVPYKALAVNNVKTGITGRILDNNGNPQPDVVVFAYSDISMTGNAMFVSDRTGEDGIYVIGFFEGGTYYLSVKSFKEGPPDMTMVHGGNEPLPVTVETGRVITGLDLGQ